MTRMLVAAALTVISTLVVAQGTCMAQSMEGRPHLGLHHAAITVSDIDATVSFYSKAVTYKIVRRYRVNGAAFPKSLFSTRHRQVEIALVEMPTGYIQLMDFEPRKASEPNGRPLEAPGYNHICFQSSSKDPAIFRFIAAGLQVISRFGKPDGVDIGGYGVRYAYGRDPDGIMIENESLDAPRRNEASWTTHVANVVHNRDNMVAFYEKLLAHKAHRTIEQEHRPRLDDVTSIDNLAIRGGWLNVGNMDIEVWQYVRPETPAPTGKRKLDEIGYNAFSLEVTDLKAEQTRLKALDIEFAGPAMTVGGWKVQYAYDPEGNLFSVQQAMAAGKEHSVKRLAALR